MRFPIAVTPALQGQADRLAELGHGLGADAFFAGEFLVGGGRDARQAGLRFGQGDRVVGVGAGRFAILAA